VLHLSLEVVEDRVLLQSVLISHLFDDISCLFGPEMRLLVKKIIFPILSARFLVTRNLLQNVVLVPFICLQLEGTLSLHQHLLFFDVSEELVTLTLPLVLQVSEVVLETVVRCFACLPLALVGMLSLPLHVRVDGVWALSVHHERVTCVVGIAHILPVEGATNDVVQVLIRVSVQRPIISHIRSVMVQVIVHSTSHLLSNANNGRPVVVIHRLVSDMIHTRRHILRFVDVGDLHSLPVFLGDAAACLVFVNELFDSGFVILKLGCLLDDGVVSSGAARASRGGIGVGALFATDDLILEELGEMAVLVASLLLAGVDGVGVFRPSILFGGVESGGSNLSLLS